MTLYIRFLLPVTSAKFPVFGNFGEDVLRKYVNDPRVEVDLGAVDRGSTVLAVSCRSGLKGQITMRIAQIIRKNMLDELVRIEDAP